MVVNPSISASGRQEVRDGNCRPMKGINDHMVKYVLEKTGEPFKYISLSGKRISGC